MNRRKRLQYGVPIIVLALAVMLAAVRWLMFKEATSSTGVVGVAPTTSQGTQQPPPPAGGGKERSMSAGLALLNHEPITFFGRVVDQEGKPVSAVSVTGFVMVQKKWMEGELERYPTQTNADGKFSFQGISGRDISFWFEKPGYRYDNRKQKSLFKYSLLTPREERYQPDESAPATFVLWKEHPPERVLKWTIRPAWIPADGTAAHFDLLTGKKVSDGGDLVISVTRSPLHIQRGQKFDWTVKMSVPSGGLAPMSGIYPNEAPADGYEATQYEELIADRRDWQDSISRQFYLKSRNGAIYARVAIMISAHYVPPPLSASIDAYVNPNGSRNLEFEGDKTGPPP